MTRSYAGLPELLPSWVAEHLGGLTILDEIPTGKPAVVVCHSGSRSPLATQQLHKAGLSQVANLRGGLSRWGDEGYPLESVTAS